MSRFADLQQNVVAELEDVANAHVVFTQVGRHHVFPVCPGLVQKRFWGALRLPIHVVVWVVLMHCALCPTVPIRCMFIPSKASRSAKYGPVLFLFVDCRCDFPPPPKAAVLTFPARTCKRTPFSGTGACSSVETVSLGMFLVDRTPIVCGRPRLDRGWWVGLWYGPKKLNLRYQRLDGACHKGLLEDTVMLYVEQ